MEFDLATYDPGGAPKPGKFAFRPAPLVSCLMATRGDMRLAQQAIACFQAQTYGASELIVACAWRAQDTMDFVTALGDPRVRFVPCPDGPLGAVRNAAVAAAKGPLICQWDDDDLYDPRRLEAMVGVLSATKADAAFMARVTLWWPSRKRLALTEPRLWEGTMLAVREKAPPYPEYRRGEDSAMVDSLRARARTVALDAPALYVYRVTGQNTWDPEHFEDLFRRASQDLSPDYDARTVGWPKPP